MKSKLSILVLALFYLSVNAQLILVPDSAVNIALKNNYDILVAANDAEIAKIDNTAGNAGMLPVLTAFASENYSEVNDKQKSTGSITSNYPNLTSNNVDAGIQLNWTLFDGGKMFVTKNKLNEIQLLGETQYKEKVLQTIYDVIIAYYDVVRQKQQLVSINEVISSNQERVNILKISFDAGLAPKTTLLQAQIDLNVFKESAINQQAAIIAAKRNLNQILSRDANTLFEVTDSIPLEIMPNKEEMVQKLFSSNMNILFFQQQIEIARLSMQEYKTQCLPRLSFTAGYNFLEVDNSAGSTLLNKSIGPQIGGTISIPLYQAGNARRQISSANLQLQSSKYDLESIKHQVNTELQNTLTNYENQMQMLEIEKINSAMAKENLEISMQRLRLGQSTSLELHQAQESFVESETRRINLEYNLKVAETKLKQLLSQLQ